MAIALTATQDQKRKTTLIERYEIAMEQLIENERIRLREASGTTPTPDKLTDYRKRAASLQDKNDSGWGNKRNRIELAALIREIAFYQKTGLDE